jgi:DNA-binding NarL/FixJ family response regulator
MVLDAKKGNVTGIRPVDWQIGQDGPYGLTYREQVVLQLLATGADDEQIAHALALNADTLNKLIANIVEKMQVKSRTQAGVRAIKDHALPEHPMQADSHGPPKASF